MVTVRVSKGRTINLGNFESARVDLAIEEHDVEDTPEQIEHTMNYWNKYLDNKLKEYGVGPSND